MEPPRKQCDEPDESVYVRINEVHHFHGRGESVADIARWLFLPLEEVEAIIDDPRAYMRSHGMEVKAIQPVDRMPTPPEIKAIMRHHRKRVLAERRAMHHGKEYVTYAFLDRPVYPSRVRRRCGY